MCFPEARGSPASQATGLKSAHFFKRLLFQLTTFYEGQDFYQENKSGILETFIIAEEGYLYLMILLGSASDTKDQALCCYLKCRVTRVSPDACLRYLLSYEGRRINGSVIALN